MSDKVFSMICGSASDDEILEEMSKSPDYTRHIIHAVACGMSYRVISALIAQTRDLSSRDILEEVMSEGRVDVLELLKARGVDVNPLYRFNYKCLNWLLDLDNPGLDTGALLVKLVTYSSSLRREEQLKLVEKLLASGADVNVIHLEDTALGWAVCHNDVEMVALLVQAGASKSRSVEEELARLPKKDANKMKRVLDAPNAKKQKI